LKEQRARSSRRATVEPGSATARRALRPFRYLRIPPQDRERVHLVRERVKCGKPSCRCAHGLRHGPYWFLRYQYWDGAAGRDRYAREYVPRSELPRVRRWIRRVRAETALGWGQAGLIRRILRQVERRRARRTADRRQVDITAAPCDSSVSHKPSELRFCLTPASHDHGNVPGGPWLIRSRASYRNSKASGPRLREAISPCSEGS